MQLLLHQGELLDLGENLKGLTVICCSGCCWLTQEGDSRDFILRDNAQIEVHSHGRIMVCASKPCRLQLLTHSPTNQQALIPAFALLQ